MSIVRVEKHNYTVEPFYQWDRNQVLTIYGLSLPSTPEVHFYNTSMERAIVRQATMDSAGVITVSVPNGLLQKPYTITAHLCVYNGATFETQYTIKLPITERKQPADYTIEDDGDVYSFNELSNKVDQAVSDMKVAEENLRKAAEEVKAIEEGIDDIVEEKTGPAVQAAVSTMIDKTLSQEGKAADAKAIADLLTPVTLWENPTPTSEFAAQTVALDLSAYPRVSIFFRDTGTATDPNVYELMVTGRRKQRFDLPATSRSVEVTDAGAIFEDGKGSNNATNNNVAIPVKIIGYKY
jgi:hypothetical protein